jgi:hypothetical protein
MQTQAQNALDVIAGKLLYLWIFVSSTLVGSVLATPIEALVRFGPGGARMATYFGSTASTVPVAVASGGGGGESAAAAAGPLPRTPVRGPSAVVSIAAAPLTLAALALLAFASATGVAMVVREYYLNDVLFDQEMLKVCGAAVPTEPSHFWSGSARLFNL